MTRPKLVTLKTKASWEPVVQSCADALMKEEARTDNKGVRAKIRVKFPIDYKFPKPFPKWIRVPCDDPNFVIREWRAFTLMDWMFLWKLSDWSSKDIYKKRQRLLMTLAHIEKDLNGETWLVKKDLLDKELEDV